MCPLAYVLNSTRQSTQEFWMDHQRSLEYRKILCFFFHSPFVLVWRVITLVTCQTKIYESALSKLRVSPYHQTHCCPGGLGSCLHPFHLPSQSRQPSTPGGRKSTVIQCSRKKTGGLTQMKLLAKSKSENRKEAKK